MWSIHTACNINIYGKESLQYVAFVHVVKGENFNPSVVTFFSTRFFALRRQLLWQRVCLCVCVCHVRVLYQKDITYHHAINTVVYPSDSSCTMPNMGRISLGDPGDPLREVEEG